MGGFQEQLCFETKGSIVPREIEWTHKVGHAHVSRPASKWAPSTVRLPAHAVSGTFRERSRTEQTSRLLISVSLACRSWKFSETLRHSGRLPRKAKTVARKDASLLMVSRTMGWSRRALGDAVPGHCRKDASELTRLDAVRVCNLGCVIVGYGRRLPRHRRA